MAKKHANELSKRFGNIVSSLDKTRGRFEKLYLGGHLNITDIERVYDGLFLNVVGAFENFIEEVFFGLLVKKFKISQSIFSKVTFKNEKDARAVVLGKQSFLKWLPYKETQNLSILYFQDGKPFTKFSDAECSQIQEVVCIRNAIAHRSPYSMKKFQVNVIDNRALSKHEKTPSGYLRGNFRIAPDQTRYENLVFSLVTLAYKLTK